jgi:hypothetical protein
MLNRRSNEADSPACHNTSNSMSNNRQLCLLLFSPSPYGSWLCSTSWLNEVLIDQSSILCERSQHHTVHAHPADERRSSPFVEAIDAFFPDGLEQAVQGTFEFRVRLEADFDRVKRVAMSNVSHAVSSANATIIHVLTQHSALLHQRRHQRRSPCTGLRERRLWLLSRHSC